MGDRAVLANLVRRGEVRWYRFSKPDKRRPVVILTRDSHISYLNEITVAPVTSTIRDIPTHVFVGKVDGMPKDCAISLDHLNTVDKSKIGGVITALSPHKMFQIRGALLYAVGF